MANTNFLRDTALAELFYNAGAFVQTAEDTIQVFVGPFKGFSSYQAACQGRRAQNEPILYNSNFWSFLQSNATENEYFTAEKSFQCERESFLRFLKEAAKKESIIDKIDWALAGKADFQQQYDWIQNQISQHHLNKALPIALSTGNGDIPSRLPQIIEKVIRQHTPNYSYGFWNDQSGMIGYTPEVLTSWKQSTSELKTMALAGTWRKIADEAKPDFTDIKIKQEHEFVIRDVENQLADFNLIHKSETAVVELPFLYHLKTHFTYQCETAEKYLAAVHLLHPTAALGLFPRDQKTALEFSQINIQKKRQQFGAPLGFISETEGFMLVAIRNIMWSAQSIHLFAGCGVTSESVFEDEWSEILAKQDSVKKMLGLNL